MTYLNNIEEIRICINKLTHSFWNIEEIVDNKITKLQFICYIDKLSEAYYDLKQLFEKKVGDLEELKITFDSIFKSQYLDSYYPAKEIDEMRGIVDSLVQIFLNNTYMTKINEVISCYLDLKKFCSMEYEYNINNCELKQPGKYKDLPKKGKIAIKKSIIKKHIRTEQFGLYQYHNKIRDPLPEPIAGEIASSSQIYTKINYINKKLNELPTNEKLIMFSSPRAFKDIQNLKFRIREYNNITDELAEHVLDLVEKLKCYLDNIIAD